MERLTVCTTGGSTTKTVDLFDSYAISLGRLIDRKYDCEHCRHWKECNDGENCVKDAMRQKQED